MAPLRAVISASLLCLSAVSTGPVFAKSLGLPPDARAGACYIRYTAPAIIETVTEQVLANPEKRGVDPQTGQTIVISPAIYNTVTVQKIIRARQEDWAEIICVKDQTVIFIQTLQRALAARGYYQGAVTGVMDERTKQAVRKVQKDRGINSPDVTLDLAESYGLVTHRIFKQ